MARVRTLKELDSFDDLLVQLGGISPKRVRLNPLPGKATESDILRIRARTGKLCELVDGVLVEKVMGYWESGLAIDIAALLKDFLRKNNLGHLTGPDGAMKLMPGLIRIPDVAFVRWEKLVGVPRHGNPIPAVVPDLAVEVLSAGNTPGEMLRQLRDYFISGVTLVWLVDLRTHTVTVHTAPDRSTTLTEADTLDGGDVLPGLRLSVATIFAQVPAAPEAPKRKRGRKR